MIEFISIKDTQQSLGEWCRLLRKREKLTQKDLATELDLSPITISKLENGDNATLETVLKILQYFDELNSFNQFIHNKINNLNDNQSLY
ncbi:helix-turn-helix domain-containing protein [Myroides pelagicus]|uniref:Helix-turn-helix domain-containing protein n=1 Tax=Myroides pelagicus TaxID=270914 RepID=A0A7K1GQI0_9FLAO|nr:helix-turn-helix transcriptional regulator [Myroides pelagicus]MEC4114857.1 helix-turn-helix transcriptional regulator [Myroides pelagicus]MTH31101.1 helix-turn-helix domain-containing protein [Myroides pelagicus]